MKYLYGAAVQGIQQFIFQTNELKDIVGASELVENICTVEFGKELYGISSQRHSEIMGKLSKDDNAVLNAAGNIKYIFEDKAACEKMVLNFPRRVLSYAPGITISQAVVKFEEGKIAEAVNLLESRLRIQRNKPMNSITQGLMGIHRSRNTNLPSIIKLTETEGKEEFLDAATLSKRYHIDRENIIRKRTTRNLCLKAFGKQDLEVNVDFLRNSEIAFDTEDMTESNSWIAVIHADGNGVGQIVSKIGNKLDDFKKFSKALNEATINAAVTAFKHIEEKYSWKKVIPIRPIVIGGDDFTVICRADLAIEYVTEYIKHFQDNTKNGIVGQLLKSHNVFTKGDVTDCLTACAGIAFVKESYPFYYGYELAESLCTHAKKDAKNDEHVRSGEALPPSCIMFHKVQDSFIESYDDIIKRELLPTAGVSFEFGPYYLSEKSAKEKDRWTVDELRFKAKELSGNEGNKTKSDLRDWMSLLHDGEGVAMQRLRRLEFITSMKDYVHTVTTPVLRNDTKYYPVYDILSIHTIDTQITK